MTNHTIPAVEIEIQETQGAARAVLLKQEFGGNVHQVELQDVHVRWLAERMGIVPTVTAEAASMISINFGQATKFASEGHRLRLAIQRAHRISQKVLQLVQTAEEKGHEDLTLEVASATELVDFLKFVCDGFEYDDAGEEVKPMPPRPSNHVPEELLGEGGAA
ncbi:hypothetical protein [Variovorax paradoxus]|uniref:Uncharacterized protein n=1 Tax=Variovorax paradoxus (strain EPS) TaxID=595537 RepID=E6V3R5_VARPE|nr:hypothetical protein [Variovorax paradoxus]ADU36939.1 hypothetical protein Varpa_2741 [Variovorax paradoxus EPS]